jgi:hypothetical protein
MTKFNYLDDNLVVAFCLLPFILPSVGRRVASDPPEDTNNEDTNNDGTVAGPPTKKKRPTRNSKKKAMSTVKASDADAYESLILFVSV